MTGGSEVARLRRMASPVVRRRRALAALALTAAVAGAVAGAGSGGPGRRAGPSREDGAGPVRAASRLSLARATGLLVVIRFRGTTAPAYVLRALRHGRACGVILFTDNITDPTQLRTLTASLQRAADGRALIAVDQEGGPVRRIPWAAPVAGQPEQLASGTVAREASDGARDLRAAGIDVVLAPVADVPTVAGAAVAGRAFSPDSAAAAGAVTSAVRAWLAGGVAPTLKHFPGLGGTTSNTDRRAATISRSAADLDRVDLAPFRAGIAAGAPLVMASNAVYPALDPAHIATQSAAILTGLLRDRLGFRGAVITDSLEARAVTLRSDVGTAAVRSVAAGADLALTTGRGSFLPVLRALRARARADAAFARRIRAAAARVLVLRAALHAGRPAAP